MNHPNRTPAVRVHPHRLLALEARNTRLHALTLAANRLIAWKYQLEPFATEAAEQGLEEGITSTEFEQRLWDELQRATEAANEELNS